MAVTAYKTPTTCETIDRGYPAWANPSNAATSDDVYASASVAKLGGETDWLRVTNFGFTDSDIPVGATIDGFDVKLERKASAIDSLEDGYLYLVLDGVSKGSNKAIYELWGTSDAEVVHSWTAGQFGGLTAADVKTTGFGTQFVAWNAHETLSRIAYVDCISIRIYYTAAVTFQPWAIIM